MKYTIEVEVTRCDGEEISDSDVVDIGLELQEKINLLTLVQTEGATDIEFDVRTENVFRTPAYAKMLK